MIKILVVDDDPDIRRLVELQLTRAGYEVVCAIDGVDGVAKALAERPTLVILDIVMPRLDGYAAASRIIERTEMPPLIVFMSAKSSLEDIRRGLDLGAEDYIVKPFEPRELVARIKTVLDIAGK